eukprot:jgi/Chrzof1/1263/Cz01g46230.t1
MAEDSKTSKSDEPYQLKAEHSCKVIDSHMPEVLEKDAITIALAAVDQNKNLKDIAQFVKHEYDKKHPGSGKATEGVYHCVVGKTFASAISHETWHYIHMKVDTYHVILWKSKDSPFHMVEN